MKEIPLNNITLNTQNLILDQEHRGQLVITNTHDSFGTFYKIKAFELNIIQVRPSKGHIKPLQKITVQFKLSEEITQEEMQLLQQNHRFLIQFLNLRKQDATRQQVQNIWSCYKNKTIEEGHEYGCCRLNIKPKGRHSKLTQSKKHPMFQKQTMNMLRASQNLGKNLGKNLTASINRYIEQIDNTKESQKIQKKSVKINPIQSKIVLQRIVENQQQMQQKKVLQLQSTQSIKNKISVKKFHSLPKMPTQFEIQDEPMNETSTINLKYIIFLVFLFLIAFMAGNYSRYKLIKQKVVVKKPKSLFQKLFR